MSLRRSLLTVVGVMTIGLGVVACGGGTEAPEPEATETSAAESTAATGAPAATGSEVAGEGTATAEDARPLRIAYSVLNMNGFVQANIDGLEEAAAPAEVTVFVSNFDPVKQNAQIEDAVTSGNYDALVVVPTTGVSLPSIQKAIDAGLPVATTIANAAEDRGNTAVPGVLISTNQAIEDRGTGLGELIVQACEGIDPCKVAYIQGVKSQSFEQPILENLEAVLNEHANIDLVAVVEGKFDPTASKAAAQTVLQANPDLNVIAGGADLMTQGAQLAVESAGKEDQVILVGNGASEQGCALVADGTWFGTYVTVPRTEGVLVGEALRAAIDEGAAPASPTPDPIAEAGGLRLITEDNVDECPGEWRL